VVADKRRNQRRQLVQPAGSASTSIGRELAAFGSAAVSRPTARSDLARMFHKLHALSIGIALWVAQVHGAEAANVDINNFNGE